MLGRLGITTKRTQSGLESLRSYLGRLEGEVNTAQWNDCYFPGCMCGITRLALTPEITLNCDTFPGASCDNLPGCEPEFSENPWVLSDFSWTHDEAGASYDLSDWPGSFPDDMVESLAWYTDGMGFTVQGVGTNYYAAFDVGEAYSLEQGVTYAGVPSLDMTGVWDHQYVDGGNKVVTVTTNPITVRVYSLTIPNEPMSGISAVESELVINTVRASLDDDMPGVKIHMEASGQGLWMWVRTSNISPHFLYIRLSTPFDVSSEVYNRLSQLITGPEGHVLTNSTIQSMDLDIYGSRVVVLSKYNPSNPGDNGTLWSYNICSHQEGLVTCDLNPDEVTTPSGAIESNLNSDIRGAHINPNGSSIFFFGAGTQGTRMYKAPFGKLETNCDIWNIFINADHAPLIDTGYSPVYYGWTEAGGANHKFYAPKIYSVCPTATPYHTHYGKNSGVTPFAYTDTGAGVTAGEINYPSKCFGTPGGPHYAFFSVNTPQSFIIEGVQDSYIDLPALSVSAQDADGNNYRWYDFDPGSTEGNKIWMVENLQTRNMYTEEGEQAILQIPGNNIGDTFLQDGTKYDHAAMYVEPGWSSNGEQNHFNATEYGLMYNWKAAHTEGICPIGWHVPTPEDWRWLEENEADLPGDQLDYSAGPDLRGNTEDSGYKTMDYGRHHWLNNNGYKDDPTSGESYKFDTYGTGFFFTGGSDQGSFAAQNYPFRENTALWAYEPDGSIIHWWATADSGIGLSNLGDEEVMAAIRCKLNDDVKKVTDGDGVPEWTRGPDGVVPSIYINFAGDHMVATKQEYCKSVGCNTVQSAEAPATINSDSTWMFQFNGTKWSLYNCTTGTGGACSDPRLAIYVECGSCDGLMASNNDAYNTCSGPPIH